MKRNLLLASVMLAGVAGVGQAATLTDGIVSTTFNQQGIEAGHLMKVARVFLGYDQFGRPVYGHRRLPRVIVGYDRTGRPIYGHVYNNRPLFLAPNVFNTIVRPYNRGWDWGHRRWDRGEHRGWNGDQHDGNRNWNGDHRRDGGDRHGQGDHRRHDENNR